MVTKLITPIKIHSVTPKTRGRIPTDFNILSDNPDPIKKSVIVIPILDNEA